MVSVPFVAWEVRLEALVSVGSSADSPSSPCATTTLYRHDRIEEKKLKERKTCTHADTHKALKRSQGPQLFFFCCCCSVLHKTTIYRCTFESLRLDEAHTHRENTGVEMGTNSDDYHSDCFGTEPKSTKPNGLTSVFVRQRHSKILALL